MFEMSIGIYVSMGLLLLFLLFALLLFWGRGDWLIAGYNTASRKEKERCNIVRLRLLMGCFCLYMTVVMGALVFVGEQWWYPSMPVIVGVLPLLILANTWAMKK